MKQLTINLDVPSIQKYGTHTSNNLPKGWRFQETPGHGYLYPSDEDNKNVPELLRTYNYEEDCAYNIPIYYNPQLFTFETWKYAEENFKNWFPKEYEKLHGRKLERGESSIKDQYYFTRLNNVGKWERGAAFGDWCYDVPKGMIYAYFYLVTEKDATYKIGRPDKATERTGLITSEQYDSGQYHNENEIQFYERNEKYYTWDSFTKETGQQRTK